MITGDIPSRQLALLKRLLGCTVAKMTRYSWYPVEELASEYEVPPHDAFTDAPGPLLLHMDAGWTICFASDPSLMSVTPWLEAGTIDSVTGGEKVLRADRLHPIEATDARYTDSRIGALIGRRILDVRVLKRAPHNAKQETRPREAGVVLHFEGGEELVAVHGLHNGSDDFAVVLRERIPPAIAAELTELTLDGLSSPDDHR